MVTPGILIGGAALMRHGWTTQLHRLEEYAVPVGSRIEGPGEWRLLERPWPYISALEALSSLEDGTWVAGPEAALADAILSAGTDARSWLPDPDDIDPDGFSGNRMPALCRALHALGAGRGVMDLARDRYGDALETSAPAPCYAR